MPIKTTCPGCNNTFMTLPYRLRNGQQPCCSRKCIYRANIQRRFWAKVEKRGNECWEWNANKARGYGHFVIAGKTYKAHRISYEWHFGPIPKGKIVCHSCDNPCCVNPTHLWLGTYMENAQDAITKGRYRIGVRHHKAVLRETDVLIIWKMLSYKPAFQIAKQFGVHSSTIYAIKEKRHWRHI